MAPRVEEKIRYGLPARVFSVLYALVLMLTPVCAFVGPWREGPFDGCEASLVRAECFGSKRYIADWGDAAWPTGKQHTAAAVALTIVVLDSVVRVVAVLVCIACGHPDIGISPWAALTSSLLGFTAVLVVGVGWELDEGASDGWGFICCLVQAILDLLIGVVLMIIRCLRRGPRKKPKPKARAPPPKYVATGEEAPPSEPWEDSYPAGHHREAIQLGPKANLQVSRQQVPEPAPAPAPAPVEWRHASTYNPRYTDGVYADFGGGVFGRQGELIDHPTVRNVSPELQQSARRARSLHSPSPTPVLQPYAAPQYTNPLDEEFAAALATSHPRERERTMDLAGRIEDMR